MARLIYGMMQSLDGYVAGPPDGPQLPPPGEALHRVFNQQMRHVTGLLYGRRMYEMMRYWDQDQSTAPEVARDFALWWRKKTKWVVSRGLPKLGYNASLISGPLQRAVEVLKAELPGEIEVAGPELAASLSALGLIDEYHFYLVPVVLGGGKPFLMGSVVPPLRAAGAEELPDGVMKLRYVKAVS